MKCFIFNISLSMYATLIDRSVLCQALCLFSLFRMSNLMLLICQGVGFLSLYGGKKAASIVSVPSGRMFFVIERVFFL